ncbi:hypothetical protein EVAR_89642_1 [Eumeta japonica]|uniref:Uncharacterized protein n=1 Tax=Eumeta variegata TaxID=151549 RepID=A0A4C1Z8A4_EUMVA|nr:hypothetical protein EVAR_89642_1 [Eumeta japonica]
MAERKQSIFSVSGKATLNMISDANDPGLLTLADNIVTTDIKSEVSLLQEHTQEQEDKEVHVITDQDGQLVSTTDGSVIRLVQIQLADGNNGWAMINTP